MHCRVVQGEQTRFAARSLRRAALAVAALVLLGTTTAAAQEQTPPRTHTVKRGDTLWDLARLYLGDPFLWPEIYRLNTAVIDDPHWIYPGEVLKLPVRGAGAVVAEGPRPAAPEPANPTEAQPTPSVPEPTPADFAGPTVFPKPLVVQSVRQRVRVETPEPVVRLGEFQAAPFLDRRGGPRGAGSILKVVNLSVTVSGRDPKARLQLHDDVLIAPPAGSAAPEGERYVSYRVGPYIEDLGQVVVPTGIVQVTRAPRSGEAAIAQVVKMFGEIQSDQRLMPYDSTALQVTGRAQAVAGSGWSSVKLIPSGAVLPAVQDYLVLDVSSRDGIKIGDEFLLFQPRQRSDVPGGLADPEIPIARAQAVRVTPYGTTLIITGEKHPKIEVGTMARRTATMP
jgi:LysM repeat protein